VNESGVAYFAIIIYFLIVAVLGLGVWVGWLLYRQAEIRREYQSVRQEWNREYQALVEEYQAFRDEAERMSREEWLNSLQLTQFRNGIDVQAKLIFPLMLYLGYRENAMEIRVPAGTPESRRYVPGEADWVIWGRGPDLERPQALLVLAAKDPTQPLDSTVQPQVRSHASSMNAPTYALTNGRRLQVFQWGADGDTCVVDCALDNLAKVWADVYQAMGARRRLTTR
jgi:hypothetical protein